ncbi:hypothetical protein QQP08_019929 [Theobroma cacao]|uniref:Uncharacterized protein n=1 Tax=Theobroma cacao TaxID=3641 RepID=A0A061GGI0_THECC|nr:Uncharacterized protein TCM_029871 [Theobroma cacao]WRX27442.1 hypothetical protein QQP08_019929 [Theobroma cacao]
MYPEEDILTQMPKEICPKGTVETTKDSKCQRRFAQMDRRLHWRKLPEEISHTSNKEVNLPGVLFEGQSEVPSMEGDPQSKSCK